MMPRASSWLPVSAYRVEPPDQIAIRTPPPRRAAGHYIHRILRQPTDAAEPSTDLPNSIVAGQSHQMQEVDKGRGTVSGDELSRQRAPQRGIKAITNRGPLLAWRSPRRSERQASSGIPTSRHLRHLHRVLKGEGQARLGDLQSLLGQGHLVPEPARLIQPGV